MEDSEIVELSVGEWEGESVPVPDSDVVSDSEGDVESELDSVFDGENEALPSLLNDAERVDESSTVTVCESDLEAELVTWDESLVVPEVCIVSVTVGLSDAVCSLVNDAVSVVDMEVVTVVDDEGVSVSAINACSLEP